MHHQQGEMKVSNSYATNALFYTGFYLVYRVLEMKGSH